MQKIVWIFLAVVMAFQAPVSFAAEEVKPDDVYASVDVKKSSWFRYCLTEKGMVDICEMEAKAYLKELYKPTVVEYNPEELPQEMQYESALISAHEQCVMDCFQNDATQQCVDNCAVAYPF